jgi:transcription initiation factor IIF auxiliary subunit
MAPPPLADFLVLTLARNSDKPSGIEGFPQRQWNIEIVLLNEHGEELPASVYEKAVYKLHPSFDKRAVQSTSPASLRRRRC